MDGKEIYHPFFIAQYPLFIRAAFVLASRARLHFRTFYNYIAETKNFPIG